MQAALHGFVERADKTSHKSDKKKAKQTAQTKEKQGNYTQENNYFGIFQ